MRQTKQFRQHADTVRQRLSEGKPITHIAAELGIAARTVERWRHWFEAEAGADPGATEGDPRRFGFYGCPREGGRVVKVASTDGHTPNLATVDCPCGARHTASLTWRKPAEHELREADVTLEAAA